MLPPTHNRTGTPLWSYNDIVHDVSGYPVFVANGNDAGSAALYGSATSASQTGSNVPLTPSWVWTNELRFIRSDTALQVTCLATTRRRYLVRVDGYMATSTSGAAISFNLRAIVGGSYTTVSQNITINTTPKPFSIAMIASLAVNDVVALRLSDIYSGYDVLLSNLNMVITPV